MQVLSKDDPDLVASMESLAAIYRHLNRYKDALTLQEKALAIQEKVLPTTKT